jgi:hypothetical protein
MKKPIKALPSFYAVSFDILKRIAFTHGWNLVIHGSLNRDMDLILIPWEEKVTNWKKVISDFAKVLSTDSVKFTGESYHGRQHAFIHFSLDEPAGSERQTYLDISIMPATKK